MSRLVRPGCFKWHAVAMRAGSAGGRWLRRHQEAQDRDRRCQPAHWCQEQLQAQGENGRLASQPTRNADDARPRTQCQTMAVRL